MTIKIGRGCIIHPTARLEAKELVIGDFTKIGENVRIHGAEVEIGKDAWIAPDVLIGGGRAEMGSLKTGDFLHFGMRTVVNIADKVEIGDEVGIGIESKLYTHGAYLSEYDGFPYGVGPITIGNNVWIPNAMILPNVHIGSNVVIGAMSLVNKNIASGCMAAGIPAKVLRHNRFPKPISEEDKTQVLLRIAYEATDIPLRVSDGMIKVGRTLFMPDTRKIEGLANKATERVKDLFRRHGIRFKYYNDGEMYREWD